MNLEIRAAPDHGGAHHPSRAEPERASAACPGEEQHDRDRGCSCVRGVPRGKRRTVRFDHRPRRAWPVDEKLDHVCGERRHRLRGRKCDQPSPSSRAYQHEADREQGQGTPQTVADRVEDERDVREERCFDIAHRFRPATVERQRAGGDEQRADDHQREQQAPPADCPARVDEELLPACRQRPFSALRRPWVTASCSAW